jgi:hypothetical protein
MMPSAGSAGSSALSGSKTWAAISLLIIVPLGFYAKFYTGPAANWVNNSLGGVFYEIFWCVLLFLFLEDTRPWIIATFVLTMTCVLEFLQLWHPPFLVLLRSHLIGRAVLGTSFTWSDFPYYFLGGGIGWLWMRGLQNVDKSPSTIHKDRSQ